MSKDYCYDREANYQLLDNLRAFYAGSLRPPKFWIDEDSYRDGGGKVRKCYMIRSNIVMRTPQ